MSDVQDGLSETERMIANVQKKINGINISDKINDLEKLNILYASGEISKEEYEAYGDSKKFPKRHHNGTAYVQASDSDRSLSKSLGLKSDEVVRILKVGEAVIPKEKNIKNIENPSVLKDSISNNINKISNNSSKNYITESPVTSISVGDIIIEGNADGSTVNKLNEVRNSIIKDIFAKINKHTNLSGFRNVKGYV